MTTYPVELTGEQILGFADLVRRLNRAYGPDQDRPLRHDIAEALLAFECLLPEVSDEDGDAYLAAVKAGELPNWGMDPLPVTETQAEYEAAIIGQAKAPEGVTGRDVLLSAMGAGNVHDDDEESLQFADESEWMDDERTIVIVDDDEDDAPRWTYLSCGCKMPFYQLTEPGTPAVCRTHGGTTVAGHDSGAAAQDEDDPGCAECGQARSMHEDAFGQTLNPAECTGYVTPGDDEDDDELAANPRYCQEGSCARLADHEPPHRDNLGHEFGGIKDEGEYYEPDGLPDGDPGGLLALGPQARAAMQDAADCECVFSCADAPKTACSLSGTWHVHPEWPCAVHLDAPGDR